MKQTGKFKLIIGHFLMFSLSLVLNALPMATQIMIVHSIRDNLRLYVSMIRHPVFYAALAIRKVKEHFREQKAVAKRTVSMILFKANQKYRYEKSRNDMASTRETCCYEY